MAKTYGSMVDVIPAKGGMGPGGVDKMPSARMGRLDYAKKIEEARKLSKKYEDEEKAALKAVGITRKPQRRDPTMDKEAAKRTDPEYMTSGASMRGRLFDQDDYDYGMKKGGMVKSKASKRADGCCVRGKTRA